MDILLVVDDSGSMDQEQAALAASFPELIAKIAGLGADAVDVRLGVTTTSFASTLYGIPADMGPGGALLKTEEMEQPWLEVSDPKLRERFVELAMVGVDGAGNEQPLKAVRDALTVRVADGSNADFFRADSLLAVLIITDEDDASSDSMVSLPVQMGEPIPVDTLKMSIDGARGAEAPWSVAVIAGDVEPDCESSLGSAAYAPRLEEFVGLVGQSSFGSLCSGDLSGQIEKALATFHKACGR